MNHHGNELTVEQFDMLIAVDDSGALHGAQLVIGKAAQSEHVRKIPLEISLRQNTHTIYRHYTTTCVAPLRSLGMPRKGCRQAPQQLVPRPPAGYHRDCCRR